MDIANHLLSLQTVTAYAKFPDNKQYYLPNSYQGDGKQRLREANNIILDNP